MTVGSISHSQAVLLRSAEELVFPLFADQIFYTIFLNQNNTPIEAFKKATIRSFAIWVITHHLDHIKGVIQLGIYIIYKVAHFAHIKIAERGEAGYIHVV